MFDHCIRLANWFVGKLWSRRDTKFRPRILIWAALAAIGTPSILLAQVLLPGQRLSVEVLGGTSDFPVSPRNQTTEVGGIVYAEVHKDAVGKPCLVVSPISQRQTYNNAIFDHFLLLDNHCGKEIRIRACYYKTDSCKTLAAGLYKRQQQLLGVFLAADFRFSYREYVN